MEAQILYRQGNAAACADVYQKLQKSGIETAEVNLVASLVTAGKASQVTKALEAWKIKPTKSFELAFNTACSLIENHNYADAEQLLLTAKRYITVYIISLFSFEIYMMFFELLSICVSYTIVPACIVIILLLIVQLLYNVYHTDKYTVALRQNGSGNPHRRRFC